MSEGGATFRDIRGNGDQWQGRSKYDGDSCQEEGHERNSALSYGVGIRNALGRGGGEVVLLIIINYEIDRKLLFGPLLSVFLVQPKRKGSQSAWQRSTVSRPFRPNGSLNGDPSFWPLHWLGGNRKVCPKNECAYYLNYKSSESSIFILPIYGK